MIELSALQKFAIWFLPVLFAITVHEAAHGWIAMLRGDLTAYRSGRVTLNPIKHIDWIGTVIVPGILLITSSGFIFGWAKPVPVNTALLRSPRWDSALVALAGPLSNFIMAFIWAGIALLGAKWMGPEPMLYGNGMWLYAMGRAGIIINLFLMILNLIPIPPLDGSRIVASLLPLPFRFHYLKMERYGFIILIGLLISGGLAYLIDPLFESFFSIFKQMLKV